MCLCEKRVQRWYDINMTMHDFVVYICIWIAHSVLRLLASAKFLLLLYLFFGFHGFYLSQMSEWKYQPSSRKQIRKQGKSLKDSPNDLAMCRCAAYHWHWEEHLMSSFALSIGQCLVHLQSRRGRRSPYLVDNLQMMHQFEWWQPLNKNNMILEYSCNMFGKQSQLVRELATLVQKVDTTN